MRRRRRVRAALATLLHTPLLVATWPSMATWTWDYADPYRWLIYTSFNGGATWTLIEDYWANGNARQFAPDGGSHLIYVVGVDAEGVEVTERSNAVRPDDAPNPTPARDENNNAAAFPDDGVSANGYDMPGNEFLFHLDELSGYAARDASGQGRNGVCEPAPVAGLLGGARSFSGVDGDYVEVSGFDTLPALTAPKTLLAWIWLDDSGPNGPGQTVFTYGTEGFGSSWSVVVSGGYLFLGGWFRDAYISDVPIASGEWHHLAVVQGEDGLTATFYLDGEWVGESNFPSALNSVTPTFACVGARFPGTLEYCWSGKLDEVALFSRAMAAEEVNWIYNYQLANAG